MKLKTQPIPVLDAHLEAELLEGLAPLVPGPGRSESMRSRLAQRVAARGDGEDFVTVHRHEGEWRPVAPRVTEKRLVVADGIYACLLRLEAGASLPPHDHPTPEECVVLEGEVWLGDVFCRAGDFHRAPRGLRHGAIRTEGGCLLYLRTGGGKGAPLL
jgi:quercetin dioxygenase-like cupin family protein